MAGYQYAHLSVGTASYLADEVARMAHASEHVREPQKPIVRYGMDPAEIPAWVNERVKIQKKKLRGTKRRIRTDTPTCMGMVCSWPITIADMKSATAEQRETFEMWVAANIKWAQEQADKMGVRLLSVAEHVDEKFPHLHFLFAVDPEIAGAGDRMNARAHHPGEIAKAGSYAASKAAGREGKPAAKMAGIAYRERMREWQTDYYEGVSKGFGLTRDGPKRRRDSRAAWNNRQLEAELDAKYGPKIAEAITQAKAAKSQAEAAQAQAAADAATAKAAQIAAEKAAAKAKADALAQIEAARAQLAADQRRAQHEAEQNEIAMREREAAAAEKEIAAKQATDRAVQLAAAAEKTRAEAEGFAQGVYGYSQDWIDVDYHPAIKRDTIVPGTRADQAPGQFWQAIQPAIERLTGWIKDTRQLFHARARAETDRRIEGITGNITRRVTATAKAAVEYWTKPHLTPPPLDPNDQASVALHSTLAALGDPPSSLSKPASLWRFWARKNPDAAALVEKEWRDEAKAIAAASATIDTGRSF